MGYREDREYRTQVTENTRYKEYRIQRKQDTENL